MKKFKCGVIAGVTMLSLTCFTPTFAVCDETDPDCIIKSDTVQVGSPNEVTEVVKLSSVSVSPNSVSVARGETKMLNVTYNDGFDMSNIDKNQTSVALKNGEDQYFAFVGFNYTYDEQSDELIRSFDQIYVDGNKTGNGVFTVTVTDTAGNTATTDFAVEVEDALLSGYGNVTSGESDGKVIYEAGVNFETPVEGGQKLSVKLVPMTDALKALDPNIHAVLDLTIENKDGGVIPVTNNNATIWFGVIKDVLTNNEQYFQIAYIDQNGKIAKYFDINNFEDDGWGYMFDFQTNHLSSYAILASATPFESAESRNAALNPEDTAGAPNTGIFTTGEEASLMSNSGLIATITVLSLVLAVYGAIKYVKQ